MNKLEVAKMDEHVILGKMNAASALWKHTFNVSPVKKSPAKTARHT